MGSALKWDHGALYPFLLSYLGWRSPQGWFWDGNSRAAAITCHGDGAVQGEGGLLGDDASFHLLLLVWARGCGSLGTPQSGCCSRGPWRRRGHAEGQARWG
uniref:Uncharacterized protein n=1 Tax=Phasianus colchicus TaxID=9054 RepID=A0A669PJ33_PHACC